MTSFLRLKRQFECCFSQKNKCDIFLDLLHSGYWFTEYRKTFSVLSFHHFLTSSYILRQYLLKLWLYVYETSQMYRTYTKEDVVKLWDIFSHFLSIDRYFPLLSIKIAIVHNSRVDISKSYQYTPIKLCECVYNRISKRYWKFSANHTIGFCFTDSL